MPEGASPYPISQRIAQIILNSGYSNYGFVLTLGAESALPSLESWLSAGEGPESLIARIAAAYPDEPGLLKEAVVETARLKAAGVSPAQLELAKAEWEFKRFIFAQGERRVPTQITIFAISGGFGRWATIQIPPNILALTLDDQLAKAPELMAAYRERYGGKVPFMGPLEAFVFVLRNRHYRFDPEGNLLAEIREPFVHGDTWVELR
jgi:hypothetical protein